MTLHFTKSLRWRLQAWHALMLLLVVAGFATVLYFQIRKSQYDAIDGDLVAAARGLEGALRVVPPMILERGPLAVPRPDEMPPDFHFRVNGGADRDGADRPPRDDPPRQREPDGRGSDDHGADDRDLQSQPPRPPRPQEPADRAFATDELSRSVNSSNPAGDHFPPPGPPGHFFAAWIARNEILSLQQSFVERFTEGPTAPYFAVWAGNGDVIKSVSLPDNFSSLNPVAAHPGADFRAVQRGPLREVTLAGPGGSKILVGRSIESELSSLRGLFWQLVCTGLGVFAVGLAGGWWLSRRAVQPIEAMSATAASISAANLHQRIDVAGVDDELALLGRVLNAMFDRLESAFAQQVRFTADASHELRTPLSVVLANTEVALGRARSADEYRETLETCLRAARRMKFLADDLLVLSRADTGKLELQSVRTDLKQVVEECARLMAPLADGRGVEISVEGDSAFVVGDPDRLAQVVTNLLSNAIAYNRPQGKVCLRTAVEPSGSLLKKGTGTSRQNGLAEENGASLGASPLFQQSACAVLSVADTGEGIPADDLPHVFERFYRVDKSRSRAKGGSGLGLAICRTIVAAHGGAIEIASQPDRGTTITVRLPADATQPAGLPRPRETVVS